MSRNQTTLPGKIIIGAILIALSPVVIGGVLVARDEVKKGKER